MSQPAIVYGWRSASDVPLYVYQRGISWGVIYDPKEATPFHTIQDCIDHWLSKHSFPDQYRHLLNEGFLHFMDQKTGQMIIGPS